MGCGFGRLQCQGRGGLVIDKSQFETQGDLHFIAITQVMGRVRDIHTIDMGSVLAAQILNRIAVAVPKDAGVVAAHLAVRQGNVAFLVAPDDQGSRAIEGPALAGLAAMAQNQHCIFMLSGVRLGTLIIYGMLFSVATFLRHFHLSWASLTGWTTMLRL